MSFEILKSVEALIAIIVAVAGMLAWLIKWVWDKVSAKVQASVDPLAAGSENIVARLSEVEKDVGDVRRHVNAIETRVGGLASKEDLHSLALMLTEVGANSRATDQKVDTLYRAVMERARE